MDAYIWYLCNWVLHLEGSYRMKTTNIELKVIVAVAEGVKVADVKGGVANVLNRYSKSANIESAKVSRPRARPKLSASVLRVVA